MTILLRALLEREGCECNAFITEEYADTVGN
jgi:hypothetical protein